jgi:hypothetical protein
MDPAEEERLRKEEEAAEKQLSSIPVISFKY